MWSDDYYAGSADYPRTGSPTDDIDPAEHAENSELAAALVSDDPALD